MARTWTEKHIAEARRALFHLAGNMCPFETEDGPAAEQRCLRLASQKKATASRAAFTATLREAIGYREGLPEWMATANALDITKRLRTVCARAEGLERVDPPETFFRVRFVDGTYAQTPWGPARYATRKGAYELADLKPGSQVVHVTLTRRILKAKKGGG